MKLTDAIVNRIGSDKLLHYFIGAYTMLMALVAGTWVAIITFLALTALSIWKETKLDAVPDWWDLCATELGIITSVVYYVIMM